MTSIPTRPPAPFPGAFVAAFLAFGAARCAAAAEPAIDFARDVRPILAASCLRCHGPEKQQGGLRLDVRAQVFAGGDSGEPAVVPRDAAKSGLLARVRSDDDSLRMPPEGAPLSAEKIAVLERWIASGGQWPDDADVRPAGPKELVVLDSDRAHWAYAPWRNDAFPPQASDNDSSEKLGEIDRFLLVKLKTAGLKFAPPASPRTLARRLRLGTTGLPPTPAEAAAFEADPSPESYTQVVDELLSDPRAAERKARRWLDVVRYADSDGYETDADRPHAFPYRDFVVKAFAEDLPFDRFVRLQLAADETAGARPEDLAAVGFLAAGPIVTSDTKLVEEQRRYRADELDDIVSTVGQAFLGLTIGCARCHDHKYDAFPTRDYYRLQATFAAGKRQTRDLPDGKVLVHLEPPGAEAKSWLLERGDVMSRKEEVSAGFLQVLTTDRSPSEYLQENWKRIPDAKTNLARSALADWLVDAEHGAGRLTARVVVNRIWQLHFGEGLVRTPNDFGVRGEPPTHPELLDWLARTFVAEGWSVRKLERRILHSLAWRQGTRFDAVSAAKDPENRLLWRRTPQRLEAETLRDAMLFAAGGLNLEMFGPGVKPPIPPAAMNAYNTRDPYPKDAVDDARTRRRSVYLFTKRSLRHPILETFDIAGANASCGRRSNTTVAPQALLLLNDPLVRRWAGELAERSRREGGADPARFAFESAFSRPPNPGEQSRSATWLAARTKARRDRGEAESDAASQALADYCHALFCMNEFMYVD